MRRTLALLCVLILAMAACGSDDGTTDPTSPPDAGGSDTEADDGSSGGADDGTGESEPSDDGGSAQGLPPGGTGTVTIDGETIEAEWVGNCLIDEMFDPQPGDLDLTAALGSGLDALFLEISNRTLPMGEEPYEYLQFRPELQMRSESGNYASYEAVYVTGPDGEWYEDVDGAVAFTFARGEQSEATPLDTAPLVLEDGRVTGSFVLEGDGGPIEISYDLAYIEAVDCSL